VLGGGSSGGGGGRGRSPGPSKDDLSITSQMARLMTQMEVSSNKIAESFETQASASAKMADNMKGMQTGEVVNQLMQVNVTLKEVLVALQNLNTTSIATFQALASGALAAASASEELAAAVNEAGTAADKSKTSMDKLREALAKDEKSAKGLKKKLQALGDYLEDEFPVAVGAALGALSGLKQGFDNLTSIGSSILGFAGSVVSALWDIGMAILSLPIKIWDKLISMAKKGGGISEFAEAINNLRKEFAEFGPVGKSIKGVAAQMPGFVGSHREMFSLFGNTADRIKKLTELYKAGGAALQGYVGEMNKNGGAILQFQKGLGATDEQMGLLAQRSQSTGNTLTHELMDITKHATHMAKAFGRDHKQMSMAMIKATSDVAHFGSMSIKQVGVAVTYFHKLGVEVDKIVGVMDSFSTFDEAADKVSTLNQVFGTSIDAMKLINAQSPDETIEHLRKEFARAGIDGEKMTRAQRSLIKSMTNMDDAEQKLVFSSKNRGISLDKIRKEGDKAEKKTLTQAEAMSKLADSMDRVLKSGESKEGGFFAHFFEGFVDGIARTKEFQGLMKNINRSLMEVYQAGVRLGKAFVEYFPGVKDFLEGLKELFNPVVFSKLANGVTNIFIDFFKDLEKGKASFPDLMDRLKKKFFEFFSTESIAGQKLLGGFEKIMMAIRVILAQGIKWVMETLTGFIKDIVSFIKNPTDIPGVGGLGDAAQSYISPIALAFREGWNELWPALQELFTVLFEKLKAWLVPKAEAFFREYWPYLAAIVFGPAILMGFVGAATVLLGKAVVGIISKAFGSNDVQKSLLEQLAKINETLAKNAGAASAQPSIPNMSPKDIRKLKRMEAQLNWIKIKQFLVGFAGIVAIGLAAFFAAIFVIRKFKIRTEEILMAAAAMVTVGLTVLMVTPALKVIERMKEINPSDLLKKMGAIGLFLGGAALIGIGAAKLVKESGITKEDAALAGAIMTGMIILATATAKLSEKLADIDTKKLKKGGLIILAMSGLMLIVGTAGAEIVDSVKGFNEAQIKNAGLVMVGTMGVIGMLIAASLGLGAVIEKGGAKGAAIAAIGVGVSYILTALLMPLMELIMEIGQFLVEKTMGIKKEDVDVALGTLKVVGGAVGIAIASMVSGLAGAGIAAIATIAGKFLGVDLKGQMTGLIDQLVGVASNIVTSLSQFRFDGSVEKKIDVLQKIAVSVGKITEVLPNILDKLDFSWWESSEDQAIKLQRVADLAKELFTGLTGLMKEIFAGIRRMSADEKSIAAAEALGPMLEGIAGIASAFSNSSLSDAFKNIDDSDFFAMPDIIAKMKELTKETGTQIVEVIKGVNPLIEAAKNIKNVDGIKAVGVLMQAIATIAQAITPSKETLTLLTQVSKNWGENTTATLRSLTEYMKSTASVLTGQGEGGDGKGGLIGAVVNQLEPLLNKMKDVKIDDSTAKAIGSIVDIVKVAVDLVIGISTVAKDVSAAGGVTFNDAIGEIVKQAGLMLDSLSKNLTFMVSALAGGLVVAAGQMTPEQLKNLEPLGKLIESILKLVVALMPQPSWPPPPDPSKVAAGALIVTTMTASFPSIKQILLDLKETLPALIQAMVTSIESLKISNAFKLTANLDTVIKIFELLPKIAELGKVMGSGAEEATGVNFSLAEGKKLGFAMDAIAFGLLMMVDTKFYQKEGGIGEAPLRSLVENAFGSKNTDVWTKASVLGAVLDPVKVFVQNLGSIVEVVKGLKSAATDFASSKEEGKLIAAGVDAIAWTFGYLVDTKIYNEGGGAGRAPLVYLTDIFTGENEKIWSGADAAIYNSYSKVDSIATNLKNVVDALARIPATATDFEASKTWGKGTVASIAGITYALGSIMDTGMYNEMGGEGNAPLVQMGLMFDGANWKGAQDLQNNMNSIGNFLLDLTEVATLMNGLEGNIIQTGKSAYAPMVDAIEGMINAIVDIDSVISGVQSIDIGTTLDRFKANFGEALGQRGQHYVKAKDLTINVNFVVMIDATKIEGAIISSDSKIKQQINTVYEAVGEIPASEVGLDKNPNGPFQQMKNNYRW